MSTPSHAKRSCGKAVLTAQNSCFDLHLMSNRGLEIQQVIFFFGTSSISAVGEPICIESIELAMLHSPAKSLTAQLFLASWADKVKEASLWFRKYGLLQLWVTFFWSNFNTCHYNTLSGSSRLCEITLPQIAWHKSIFGSFSSLNDTPLARTHTPHTHAHIF